MEKSYWWTTGGAGDGASTYTRTDLAVIARLVTQYEGVISNYKNELAGSVPAANTFRIATGGGVVDGKPYDNTANVDVNIPSAVGGGNTRIDRIVLRADWTAQTVRIYRIAGVDAGSPVPPAITQNSGTTYDNMLYQVRVNTSGTVTIELDERVFAQVDTNGIKNLAISTAKLANNVVDNTKLRDSAAFSVIGRPTNTSGDPSDIAASADGQVLRRVTGGLAFDTIINSSIADAAVTLAKLSAGVQATLVTNGDSHDHAGGDGAQVPTSGLADNAVDDTKVGNRVPQFYRRQGGSGSDWSVPGSNNYTPTTVRMQAGVVEVTITDGSNTGNVIVTFPVAFSNPPIISLAEGPDTSMGQPNRKSYSDGHIRIIASLVSASQLKIEVDKADTSGQFTYNIHWLAIGPE